MRELPGEGARAEEGEKEKGQGGGLQVEKLRLGQGNSLPVQSIFCCGLSQTSWVLVQVTPSELTLSEPSSRYFMFSLNPSDDLQQKVPLSVYSKGN